jgi:hypothetical protein
MVDYDGFLLSSPPWIREECCIDVILSWFVNNDKDGVKKGFDAALCHEL